MAIAFAREGADVAIGYLPSEEEDAREVVALIKQAGVNAVAIPGDIVNEDFCRTMVERANKELGGIDILVNNAGTMSSHESLTKTPTADFDKTMKTNVYSLFWDYAGSDTTFKAGRVDHQHCICAGL